MVVIFNEWQLNSTEMRIAHSDECHCSFTVTRRKEKQFFFKWKINRLKEWSITEDKILRKLINCFNFIILWAYEDSAYTADERLFRNLCPTHHWIWALRQLGKHGCACHSLLSYKLWLAFPWLLTVNIWKAIH